VVKGIKMNTTNVLLIPLLPFLSFLVLGLAGKKLFGDKAGLVGTLLMFVSFILAVVVAADYFGSKTGRCLSTGCSF
jgi:NADH-quinone oxidoreductase subunit L